MSTELYDATKDLGKTGYFPFSLYKNITVKNVMDAIKYEEKGVFNEYIQSAHPRYLLKPSTLLTELTNESEINVTVAYGNNEGIYLDAYTYHYGRKNPIENIIVCKTLSKDDHTMARAWQSAGNIYRFVNGWWK